MLYFEKKYFNQTYIEEGLKWNNDNWWISLVYVNMYISLICLLKKHMKYKRPHKLKCLLFMWNISLSIFSLIGSYKLFTSYIDIASKGLEYSMCEEIKPYGIEACWSWLFVLSKVVELFDTMFVLIRKQKLIFLHWYHHATVLIYAWYSSSQYNSNTKWFILINYVVHTFMYLYYACTTLNIRVNKKIRIALTSLQILQMMLGLAINIYVLVKKINNVPCHVNNNNLIWSFIMYFSYLGLFLYFFYNTYIRKRKYY